MSKYKPTGYIQAFSPDNIDLRHVSIYLGDNLTDRKIVIRGKKLTLKWEGKKIIVWSRNNEL